MHRTHWVLLRRMRCKANPRADFNSEFYMVGVSCMNESSRACRVRVARWTQIPHTEPQAAGRFRRTASDVRNMRRLIKHLCVIALLVIAQGVTRAEDVACKLVEWG